MAISYYSIAQDSLCGSEAILDILPNANTMNDADLLTAGYIKAEIPDGVMTLTPWYKQGKLTIQTDPPPYWSILKLNIAKGELTQRLLAASLGDLPTNAIFTMIAVSIANEDYPSLKNSLGRLTQLLNAQGKQITPEEKTALITLFDMAGFPADVMAEMVFV